ncbi:MAG: hypothetical protein J7623_10030 [Chitinophaga sp.]|uniref:hypothetical protein n=1 Tax=Chitinophaga sp. TaxID=1869181 RepID=UPI001B1C4076|nr:hypothetical protein [Chitinophaga sp.]MBO9728962.1 hypothetical protein [Chitinophaga sp.]
MKFPIALMVLVFCSMAGIAQKNELKINASANTTILPNFQNRIAIANGFNIPDVIIVNNSQNPIYVVDANSSTKSKVGFVVEAEAGRKLNNRWKLSLSLGVMQVNYSYDTYIPQSFYKNDFHLKDIASDYGNTKLTYLTSRPINVGVTFNKFSIQGGAILNYLVGKKYTNTVVVYNNNGHAAGAFFEEKGEPKQFLLGGHLNARYEIVPNLEVMLGGQYFFSSLYKKENTYQPLYDKSKALQLQLGLSYNLAPLFRK